MKNKSDVIKNQLPSNIKIGGKIINTGEMTINGKKMPKTKDKYKKKMGVCSKMELTEKGNKMKNTKWVDFLDEKAISFGGKGKHFWVKLKEKDIKKFLVQIQQDTLQWALELLEELPTKEDPVTYEEALEMIEEKRQTIKKRMEGKTICQ